MFSLRAETGFFGGLEVKKLMFRKQKTRKEAIGSQISGVARRQ